MDGVDGTPGYRPIAWWDCSATLDLIAAGPPVQLGEDSINETGLHYSATVFANEDVQVQCDADLGSVESAAGGAYYPAPTNGASRASCLASMDYPPADGAVGFWRFTTEESGPQAEYRDLPGHPLDMMVIPFGPDDCSILLVDDAGEWQEAALGDLWE